MHRPAEFFGADQERDVFGIGRVFRPNAPPTSSVMTRRLSFGKFMIAMMFSRMAPALCEQQRSV